MYLNQQEDKNRYEDRASQDMTADDIEREVCEENQRETLGQTELIGNLRMNLAVVVVRAVDAMQCWNPVEQ